MERQIIGRRGPVYSSRLVNRVAPSVPADQGEGADALEQAERHAAAPGHPLAGGEEAGLVTDRAEGARRLYRLDDEGIAAVRKYLEHVWGEAAARFRLLAENTGEQTGRGDR